MLGQHGRNTRPHAQSTWVKFPLHGCMNDCKLNVALILKQRGSLRCLCFVYILCTSVCTARYWQASSRPACLYCVVKPPCSKATNEVSDKVPPKRRSLQCRQFIPALNVWEARHTSNTRPHA